ARAQALELLELMDLGPSSFSPAEWTSPPLVQLETDDGALPPKATAHRGPGRAAGGPTMRGQLPAELTPLVGRVDKVQQIVQLLEGPARLVTLTGAGGVGKTRLALAAAAAVAEGSATAVCLVPLAAIRDPA